MNKVFEAITIDVNQMNRAYNGTCTSSMQEHRLIHTLTARIAFFRALQDLGDSVAELPSQDSTPLALRRHLDEATHIERRLVQSIMAKLARRRFLDSLRSQDAMEEDACLICSDASGQQLILTNCAHIFHELCIKSWCSRAGTRQCPVCRNALSGASPWQRVDLKAHTTEPARIEELKGADDVGEEITETATDADMLVATDADGADPRKQLEYIEPKELQQIKSQQLSGESLGSKLDLITKHIIYLRKKHEDAQITPQGNQDDIDVYTEATSPPSRGSDSSPAEDRPEALAPVAKIL